MSCRPFHKHNFALPITVQAYELTRLFQGRLQDKIKTLECLLDISAVFGGDFPAYHLFPAAGSSIFLHFLLLQVRQKDINTFM